MQIIFMYIQSHYVKNYMPLHKLNQAKNTSCQLKKEIMYISKCLFSLKSTSPFTNPRKARAHTDTHACAQIAHTGTFRLTNVSLAGVKLRHLAVCVHM